MSKIEAKTERGNIVIYCADLADDPEILSLFAKHAAFNRELVKNIISVMTTDEVPDEYGPWYSIVSFGRSIFEESRAMLIEHADEAAKIQVKMLKNERDTYEKYYNEQSQKNGVLQNEVWELRGRIRELKGEA